MARGTLVPADSLDSLPVPVEHLKVNGTKLALKSLNNLRRAGFRQCLGLNFSSRVTAGR